MSEPVSRVVEDYLTAIWKAYEWPGGVASTNDLAHSLGVTPSTVSATLKKLAREEYINYEPYGSITLTAAGQAIAVKVVRRHRIIETYLVEKLGLRWDQVHIEADALEHAISDFVLQRMDEVLGRPTHDPHGDPIPSVDGSIELIDAVPLARTSTGVELEVVRVSDRDSAVLRYLSARGVSVGTRLTLLKMDDAVGVLEVLLEGDSIPRELSLTAASAIWVSNG